MNIVTCPNCNMRVVPKADGTCPSCGTMLVLQAAKAVVEEPVPAVAPVPAPPQISQPLPAMPVTEAPTPLTAGNKEAERILVVIHDAIEKSGLADYTVEDIVLTDRRLGFILYSRITDPNMGFGLVGGVISVLTENKRLASLREEAARARREKFGLGLDQRLAKYMLPEPEEVENLHAINATQITLVTQGGKKYHYLVPPMSPAVQEAVNQWPQSPALYDSSDPDGFFVGSDSPDRLLLRLAGDNVAAAAAAAAEIIELSRDERYIRNLYATLLGLNQDKLRKVLPRLVVTPVGFRRPLLERADQAVRALKRRIPIFGFLLLFGVILGINAVTSPSLGAGVVALLLLALGVGLIVSSSRSLRTANEILKGLQGKS